MNSIFAEELYKIFINGTHITVIQKFQNFCFVLLCFLYFWGNTFWEKCRKALKNNYQTFSPFPGFYIFVSVPLMFSFVLLLMIRRLT